MCKRNEECNARNFLIYSASHSLHCDLTAPPAASQACVPGVAIQSQTCPNHCHVGRQITPSYSA